jgi:hypothetical protein
MTHLFFSGLTIIEEKVSFIETNNVSIEFLRNQGVKQEWKRKKR